MGNELPPFSLQHSWTAQTGSLVESTSFEDDYPPAHLYRQMNHQQKGGKRGQNIRTGPMQSDPRKKGEEAHDEKLIPRKGSGFILAAGAMLYSSKVGLPGIPPGPDYQDGRRLSSHPWPEAHH